MTPLVERGRGRAWEQRNAASAAAPVRALYCFCGAQMSFAETRCPFRMTLFYYLRTRGRRGAEAWDVLRRGFSALRSHANSRP